MNPMKKPALLLSALLLAGAGCLRAQAVITNFEECAAAGNPVMESYPRQCRAGGRTFVEIVAMPPEPQPEPEPQPAPELPAGAVELKVGASAKVDERLTLTLLAIDDSRCPKGVQCVWAGELAARVGVAVSGPDGGSLELRLGQATASEGVAYGYGITLVAITETSAAFVVRAP